MVSGFSLPRLRLKSSFLKAVDYYWLNVNSVLLIRADHWGHRKWVTSLFTKLYMSSITPHSHVLTVLYLLYRTYCFVLYCIALTVSTCCIALTVLYGRLYVTRLSQLEYSAISCCAYFYILYRIYAASIISPIGHLLDTCQTPVRHPDNVIPSIHHCFILP